MFDPRQFHEYTLDAEDVLGIMLAQAGPKAEIIARNLSLSRGKACLQT